MILFCVGNSKILEWHSNNCGDNDAFPSCFRYWEKEYQQAKCLPYPINIAPSPPCIPLLQIQCDINPRKQQLTKNPLSSMVTKVGISQLIIFVFAEEGSYQCCY